MVALDNVSIRLASRIPWPRMVLALLVSLCSQLALAMEAGVDRTEIRQSESLQLTVTAAIKLDSAFSLFDLNTLNARAPDTRELEQQFEILDRQQNYKVEIINNVNQSTVTWTYTLLPRQTGTLTIPPLQLEGEATQPISISVLPDSTAKTPGDRDIFLETAIDQSSGYVQQQLLFTVRLFYTGDLIRGELDHPDHEKALFRQIGKQREYSRYAGDRHYKVVERLYAVFPARPGSLEIPALNFSGQFLDVRSGRRVARKASTDPLTLTISPPPESFGGSVWVPALSYLLQESWSHAADEIHLGETLTRTLDQQALGLEGVSLPPIPDPVIDGLKIYAEPPQTRSEENAAGLSGHRRDVQMIVATRPGVYELPAISIAWWDVVNDLQRTATLPARKIRVTGDAASLAGSATGSETGGNPPDASPATMPAAPLQAPGAGLSPWLTITLLGAWAATALGWLIDRRRRSQVASVESATIENNDPATATTLDDLRRVARDTPHRLALWLPLWVEQEKRRGRWRGPADETTEKNLRPLINRLQALRYGRDAKTIAPVMPAGEGMAAVDHPPEARTDAGMAGTAGMAMDARIDQEAQGLADAMLKLLEARGKTLPRSSARSAALPDLFESR